MLDHWFKLPLVLPILLPPLLFFLLISLSITLRIISGRDLNNRIDHQIIIRLFLPLTLIQFFINRVNGSRIDSRGEVRMFFYPILKDLSKIWASFDRLFHEITSFFIEIVLDRKSSNHQIQDQSFILTVVAGKANDILGAFCSSDDDFVLDIPFCFFYEVG